MFFLEFLMRRNAVFADAQNDRAFFGKLFRNISKLKRLSRAKLKSHALPELFLTDSQTDKNPVVSSAKASTLAVTSETNAFSDN